MYQVIKMYGDWEPWWFLDGWTDDIVSQKVFTDFEEAARYYESQWQKESESYCCYDSHKDFLTAFWDQEDTRWCEPCGDYLQQYHSLLLLEDGEILPSKYHRDSLVRKNCKTPQKNCQLKG
ncbi:DUF1033 family protein [Streptococcus sp. zg-JUN1979]|uniref:DUF1033 family protein n=1 Tax=Streptococcus sp. zg-JUN1979 TaxID=3391450 RepID=UPI0039A40E23